MDAGQRLLETQETVLVVGVILSYERWQTWVLGALLALVWTERMVETRKTRSDREARR